MGEPHTRMKPKWARFIAEYIKCGNCAQAAREAGLNPRSGKRLLLKPVVAAEVDRLRKEIMAEGVYGLKKAMEEIDDAMIFAKQTENATALANLLQLRSKINGLIKERFDHQVSANFQLTIEGVDQVRQVGEAVLPTLLTKGKNESGS